jgi:TorA maturation chaperone TorD
MAELLTEFRRGVALDLMALAQLHDRELDRETIEALKADAFPEALALRLESDTGTEVLETLAAATRALSTDVRLLDELAADFASIYLTHAVGASPCESVWLDEDGLAMQQPMFDVRNAYARLGLGAPDWRMRPDDHLVLQLQFVSVLFERDDPSALADAARFMDDHLLRWLPDFAGRVAGRAATPFYAGLAMLTSVYVDELREILVQLLGEPRPTAEEVDRRTRVVNEVALPIPGAYVPGNAPSW